MFHLFIISLNRFLINKYLIPQYSSFILIFIHIHKLFLATFLLFPNEKFLFFLLGLINFYYLFIKMIYSLLIHLFYILIFQSNHFFVKFHYMLYFHDLKICFIIFNLKSKYPFLILF